jgi:membrane-associated protease RseP (regulator of RpoE activity)
MSHDPAAGFPAPLGAPPRYEPEREAPRQSSIPPAPKGRPIWLHFLLFALTLVSMQITAMGGGALPGHSLLGTAAFQAVSLLGILLVHEAGHYIASRLHRVPASLPFFIPAPYLGFGTFGALITMSDRIRSRKALLDIGAAGPIAGMVVAIPVLYVGLRMSHVAPLGDDIYIQEGQSILYMLMKRLVLGPIPEGSDVMLHPMAFAGWGGFFLTMLNLLPWGQLDGGHIAYALFGNDQHRFARWFRNGLLLAFAYNVVTMLIPALLHQSRQTWKEAAVSSMFWLIWYGITGVMKRIAGEDHPPFEPEPLGRPRQLVAVACLILFVLLFLPTPMAVYPAR